MSEFVIKAEGIGKSYLIGHKSNEQYTTLRDVIANITKGLWLRMRGPQSRIQKNIEEFWALRDVSFEVKQGERIGIIGRNGAGKSTLLKILSRITEPTTGRVSIKGRVASLLEVGTGFHPELTGRENIFLNSAILGMTRAEIKRKFDEIVEFAEVEKFLDTPVKHFSSGMYVRLAFAVASHLEPEILLVDEVLAVGDAAFQKKCLGKMGDVAKEGRTVLFVSHNMAAIGKLCERCFLLDHGRIVESGESQNVISRYLNDSYPFEAVREFPPDSAKVVQIRRVCLLNHLGVPSVELDLQHPFSLVTGIYVTEPVSAVQMGLALELSDGTPVCHSLSADTNQEDWSFQKAGKYEVCVEFPGALLNAGVYTVRIGAGIMGVPLCHQEVCQVRLRDFGSFAAANPNAPTRKGILLLRLPWQIGQNVGAKWA